MVIAAHASVYNNKQSEVSEASDEYESYPPDLAEANLKFKPGYFSCPVVWETPFVLHPRLKTGPGKSGISRGILALKNILDKFSVANRDNMFVYQDKNSNVFYLRYSLFLFLNLVLLIVVRIGCTKTFKDVARLPL